MLRAYTDHLGILAGEVAGLDEQALAVGMGGQNAVINSPILSWETTQTGFSMYVKYMMAGFLAVFAISMMIQFISYMACSYSTIFLQKV